MDQPEAPAVVTIVVTHNPGDWFEETLQTLADQDYANMSVLVLDAASDLDPTERIASILPDAFVRRLPRNRGFAATANEAMSMVEGATHLLFCHDDIALEPDCVHTLVEESFRSNAGIVTPKFVSWTDPELLVNVGITADKGGVVVQAVERGERDRGQHDAVKDILAAPGGCTLVRADLFNAIEGFDKAMFAFGEDLDLCWRSWIAGARIVIAPDAKVRHLQCITGGLRPLPADAIDSTATIDPPRTATTRSRGQHRSSSATREPEGAPRHQAHHPSYLEMSLRRRHELRTVLKAYTPVRLLTLLPQLFVISLAEALAALLAGHGSTARSIAGAWRWNLRRDNRKQIRAARQLIRRLRVLSDHDIHRMQARGSARLTAFFRRHDIHHRLMEHSNGTRKPARPPKSHEPRNPLVATADSGELPSSAAEDDADASLQSAPTASKNRALGASIARADVWMAGWRAPVITWSAIALFLIVGTRQLLDSQFPLVGQLGSFPGWTTFLRDFFSGVHIQGLGNGSAASPSFFLLGLGGMFFFGAVGTLHKVVVLGCLPVGIIGAYRLGRPLRSPVGRLIVAITYFAIPLPYNALANGRWYALIAYAAAPWILAKLAIHLSEGPFGASEQTTRSEPSSTSSPAGPQGPAGLSNLGGGGFQYRAKELARSRTARQLISLAVLEAVLSSFVPALSIAVVIVATAIGLGSLFFAQRRSAWKPLAISLGATALAGVLCLPWVITFFASGASLSTFTGFVPSSLGVLSWGQLLRFQDGWLGAPPLGWALLVAGALPLIIGSRWRFSWAVRMWTIALVCWALAWLGVQGWLGSVALPPALLLAPAAAAMALCAGMAWVACERDLPRHQMGWRHLVSALAIASIVLAILPVLGASFGGRWGVPANGYRGQLSWMSSKNSAGSSRVLWVGESQTLPLGSWSLGSGLTYTVSTTAIPDATSLWSGPPPRVAQLLAHAIALASDRMTSSFGHLVAPMSVRYIVVTTGVAPVIPGIQTPAGGQPALSAAGRNLVAVLAQQDDLRLLGGQPEGAYVFKNLAWLPERATITPAAAATAGGAPGALPLPLAPLAGAHEVLPGASGSRNFEGKVPSGSLFLSHPASSPWTLVTHNGRTLRPKTAFGWASIYTLHKTTRVHLAYHAPAGRVAGSIIEILLWVLTLLYLTKGYSPKRSRSRASGLRRWSPHATAARKPI